MNDKINKYKAKSKSNFDKKAEDYFNTWDGKYSELMYAGVMEKINKFSFYSILDVGCGPGVMLSRIIKQNGNIQACGIDFSAKMLEKAAELLQDKAQLVLGDADCLLWNDNTFDLVICNSSFHHYPEPLTVLMEMRRVLKPDGRLIIADPWWSAPKRFFINLYLKSPLNLEGDVKIYSEQEFKLLLMKSGFESVEWEKVIGKYCIVSAFAGGKQPISVE